MSESTVQDTTIPAPEAFAEAMKQQAHQHAAATTPVDEEAPLRSGPVQLNLLPKPPFDYKRALTSIFEKEAEVDALATDVERTKKVYQKVKSEWEEAASELAAMIRQTKSALDDSLRAPEERQQDLFRHGRECAWEREHPGQVCAVCAEDRAKTTAPVAADTLIDAPPNEPLVTDHDGPAPFVIKRGDDEYFAGLQFGGGIEWTHDLSLADTFETREQAEELLNEKCGGWALQGIEVVPDPMANDPAAAGDEPPDEPPDAEEEEPAAENPREKGDDDGVEYADPRDKRELQS